MGGGTGRHRPQGSRFANETPRFVHRTRPHLHESYTTAWITLNSIHAEPDAIKNITFTADEGLIEAAREQSRADHTTLNEQYRQWLQQYARKRQAARAAEVMDRLGRHVASGGRVATLDALNERR